MATSTPTPSRSSPRFALSPPCIIAFALPSSSHLHLPSRATTPLTQVLAPLFAYHFWNSTSSLDCTPANRATVTEQTLADPLVSLLEHGSLRDDVYGISQQPKVKYAGAYIGERSCCLPGTKCRCAAAAAAAATAAAAAAIPSDTPSETVPQVAFTLSYTALIPSRRYRRAGRSC